MTFKELQTKAIATGANITYEMCQYTGKKLIVLFVGEWSEGIFTICRSNYKNDIIYAIEKREISLKSEGKL